MSTDLEFSINHKESEFQSFIQGMEKLCLQFVNDTTSFAAEWYVKKAKEYATKKPDVTMRLGKDGLTLMKAKVNTLVENAGKFVNSVLLAPTLWWHMEPHVNAAVATYEYLGNEKVGSKYPEVLDRAVRRALGELGNVLEEFGYGVTTGSHRASYPEFWFEPLDVPGSDVRPLFPHLYDWSEEMQYTIMKYDAIYKKATALFEEITQLKEEKKKQEAKALWDNA